MENRRQDILDAVEEVESGNGVVILTDMFGGTPSNLAISIMRPGEIEVLAGVNLPMLIKLASIRQESNIKQAIEAAKESGRKYINIASELLDD
jgi:PTS system mannose-specific IIA component